MKKFVAAIASVLMVGAMLTSAMAAVPSVSVPSVSVPSVVVPSVGVKSPSVSSDITVKVIDSKTELVENEELTVRVTTLEEAVEADPSSWLTFTPPLPELRALTLMSRAWAWRMLT